MPRDQGDVPRPVRHDEYRIAFSTREAEKGWRDLVAVACNAAVEGPPSVLRRKFVE